MNTVLYQFEVFFTFPSENKISFWVFASDFRNHTVIYVWYSFTKLFNKGKILSSGKGRNTHCIKNTLQVKNDDTACATIFVSYDRSRFAEYLSIVKT